MAPSSALHPRSLSTTSLFSTTLALAFLVVAAPHVLPCPVRKPAGMHLADGEGEEEFYRDGEKPERGPKQEVRRRKCPIPRTRGGLVEEVRKWRESGKWSIDEEVGKRVVFGERPRKGWCEESAAAIVDAISGAGVGSALF
ncbi:hypothetical protein BDZ91DRAFT_764561 [Kalaharituber pfeilii]|nr:hypothetical protein BDZ91DRAFT_764561 [Kalaharituber pfeilii]